jgi:hypothetical protein
LTFSVKGAILLRRIEKVWRRRLVVFTKRIYRQEYNEEKKPTMEMMIVQARDRVKQDQNAALFIEHCYALVGFGFRPRVDTKDGIVVGRYYQGEDIDAYRLAVKEGLEMFDRQKTKE